jgi:predicted HAD superfamily Cof-like phosphohydrolase
MEIKEIKNWFEIAIPEPTIEQACIQIGCHYEEVAEMTEAMGDGEAQHSLEVTADNYKAIMDWCYNSAKSSNKIELLDSLCDQIVTAIGVAHMLGMDIEGALAEVNRSNHSKFENGKPVFNDQGKISKGKNYTPPQLEKFI